MAGGMASGDGQGIEMKINIDNESYIILEGGEEDAALLSVKVKRDDKSYMLISLSLDDDTLDKMISEMISIRARKN